MPSNNLEQSSEYTEDSQGEIKYIIYSLHDLSGLNSMILLMISIRGKQIIQNKIKGNGGEWKDRGGEEI